MSLHVGKGYCYSRFKCLKAPVSINLPSSLRAHSPMALWRWSTDSSDLKSFKKYTIALQSDDGT